MAQLRSRLVPATVALTVVLIPSASAEGSCPPGLTHQGTTTVRGRVVDDLGQPLPYFRVNFQQIDPDGSPIWDERSVPLTVSTGRDGQYVAACLSPGRYYVSAAWPAPLDPEQGESGNGGAWDLEAPSPAFYPGTTRLSEAHAVDVTGKELGGIDIVLTWGRLAVVSGTVISPTGALHEVSSVMLSPIRAAVQVRFDGFSTFTVVGPDGAFRFEGVPAGEYVLRVISASEEAVLDVARTGSTTTLHADPTAEFAALPLTIDGADVEGLEVMLGPLEAVSGDDAVN